MNRSDRLGIAVDCLVAGVGYLFGGPRLGFGLLVIGGAVLATLNWKHERQPAGKSPNPLSWTDLEARMKDLRAKDIDTSSARRDSPMDATQSRDETGLHHWWLLGSNEQLRTDAHRLFTLAGSKLKSSGIAVSPRVARETDDFSRWLWFLVEVGNHRKDVTSSGYSKETGSIETHTYWLRQVLDDSIAGCVEGLKRETSSS